jgi:membrane-bound lytic murein transglycosylase B
MNGVTQDLRKRCLNLFSRLALSACILLAPSCSHTPKKPSARTDPSFSFASPDYQKSLESATDLLKEKGVPDSLIHRIRKHHVDGKKDWPESAMKILELNLFGFLYHGNYLAHDSALARKKTAQFLRSHQLSFDAARKAYGVAPEAIAALLWVETKFGKDTGNFPLPWVFFSLSLASQSDFCNAMRSRLPARLEASLLSEKPELEAADQKLRQRCRSKSEWAIGELKALADLETTAHLRPFRIKGSFAGAFGLPQFIPTSYQKFAASSFRRKPDLFMVSDAILSVGRFLSENGWKNDSAEAQSTALYSYNRSRDYGTVIRNIAAGLTPRTAPSQATRAEPL